MKRPSKILSTIMASAFTIGMVVPTASCTEEVTFFPSVTIGQVGGGVMYTPTADNAPGKIEIPLLAGDIYTVSANYEKYITDNYNLTYEDCFAPTPLEISWECDEAAQYYTLEISVDEDMSDAESYVAYGNSVTLSNLFMGYDYYYRINAKYEDRLAKSRIFEFSTAYLPRTMYVDDNVSNTRDWGGYYATDGMRVKQGIVYRGGALENITDAGKQVMLNELGIKTDLDVRGDSGTPLLSSPLGEEVHYVETRGPYYIGRYGMGIDMEGEYREGLLKEIRVFANPDNFPVYVHCSLGRDRTGTLCFLINALLGVSEYDLYRDYELSMMARTGKDVNNPNSHASYMVRVPFTALYNYILDFQEGKTLQENAEAFMLSIGITENEIAAIRENMLEEA